MKRFLSTCLAGLLLASGASAQVTGNFIDVIANTLRLNCRPTDPSPPGLNRITIYCLANMFKFRNGAGTIFTPATSATAPIILSGGNISTQIATGRLVGRTTAGSGVMQEIVPDAHFTLSGLALGIADNSIDGTDIQIGTPATGDVLYYNGTDYVKLAIGIAGQVLEVNPGATAPEWDTDDSAAGGNSFATIDTPTGTDPIADTSTDTLQILTTAPLTIAGGNDPETATFAWSGAFADAQVDGSLEADELVLAGDVDGTANANDLDEAAVETELEGVLDAQELQGAWIRKTVATDVTTTSDTVYSAVTDLDWTAAATTNYQLHCVLWMSTAAATTGLQLQWMGTTAPTEVNITRDYNNNSVAVSEIGTTAFHTSSQDDGAAGHNNVKSADLIEGFLINGANSGTIALSIISEVNTSSVTLEKGSYCERTTF